MLMDYYLTDEYIEPVLEILNHIHHEGYYVKMGVAWIVSVIFVKYEEKARKLLQKNHLDDFTYNKALQKIIESNRVSKEVKDAIRKMKR